MRYTDSALSRERNATQRDEKPRETREKLRFISKNETQRNGTQRNEI